MRFPKPTGAHWRRLRRSFWRIPYPARYRLYRAFYTLTTSRSEILARQRTSLKPLSQLDLREIKGSDTVFILGSGTSINEISDERWKGISRHDSIGFNLWFLHPFVPTIYTTYSFNPEAYPEQLRVWGRGVLDRIVQESAARAEVYRKVPKIVMHVKSDTLELVQRLPDGFQENAYTVRTHSGLARSETELVQLLRYWDRRGAFEQQPRIHALFKYRSSITQLIALASAIGYRRIVLCGIDMTTPGYFYGDPSRYPHMAGFSSSPTQQQSHVSATRTDGSLDVVTVVRMMYSEVLKPKGIELYVENASSGLFPHVPVAPAHLFEGRATASVPGTARP